MAVAVPARARRAWEKRMLDEWLADFGAEEAMSATEEDSGEMLGGVLLKWGLWRRKPWS